jgi:hypothetical protein
MFKRFKTLCLYLSLLIFGASTISCSALKKKEGPSPFEQQITAEPQTPEQAQETLSNAKEQFLYGKGLGSVALNVGTIVAFPPYGIYVLGNSILSLAGYENLYFTDLLPEESRQTWNDGYDYVVSAPGKLNAKLQDREFVDGDGLFGMQN